MMMKLLKTSGLVRNFTKHQDRHKNFQIETQRDEKTGSSQVFHYTFLNLLSLIRRTCAEQTWHQLGIWSFQKPMENSERMYKSSTFTHHITIHPTNTPVCLGDRVLKRSLPGYTNQLQLHGFHAAPEVRKMGKMLGEWEWRSPKWWAFEQETPLKYGILWVSMVNVFQVVVFLFQTIPQ